MLKFLRNLADEIEKVKLTDKAMERVKAVNVNTETVLGILPTPLKKFFVVLDGRINATAKQCEADHARLTELVMKIRAADRDVTDKERDLLAKHELLHQELDLAAKIFWHGVREAMPGAALEQSIGIRKGWTIVATPSREPAFEVVPLGAMPPGLARALGIG